MTSIDFHVNVPDKLDYSCRLLRKAYLTGSRIAVTADAALLAELDSLLWRFSTTDFVPHCLAGARPSVLAASPVVLSDGLDTCSHREILVNIGVDIPDGFEGFERFIEVVAALPEDAESGRQRWKHYKSRGYGLVKHDFAPAFAPALPRSGSNG